jgi:hypothetical protein
MGDQAVKSRTLVLCFDGTSEEYDANVRTLFIVVLYCPLIQHSRVLPDHERPSLLFSPEEGE